MVMLFMAYAHRLVGSNLNLPSVVEVHFSASFNFSRVCIYKCDGHLYCRVMVVLICGICNPLLFIPHGILSEVTSER